MEDTFQLLYERTQIFFSAAFFFLLFLLIAWRNDYFTFPRTSKESIGKLSSRVFLGSFVIFLFLQLFFTPLTFSFWHYFYTLGEDPRLPLSPNAKNWVNVYAIFVTAVGMLLYFFSLSEKNKKIVFGEYAFKGLKAKFQDFYLALISWGLSYPLVLAVGQIVAIILLLTYGNIEPEQVAVKQIRLASTSDMVLTVLVICVIFVVPVIEELLFRGFLQNWLKGFFGAWKAVFLTSIIFAMFHFAPSQGMGNIELIVSLFVLSCFLGYLYERQKSLWAPISLHAIFNAISIMLIFYVDKEN